MMIICVDLDGHTAYPYMDCALSLYLILSHKHLRNLMLRLEANIICIILYYITYDAYLNIYIRISIYYYNYT